MNIVFTCLSEGNTYLEKFYEVRGETFHDCISILILLSWRYLVKVLAVNFDSREENDQRCKTFLPLTTFRISYKYA